MVEDLAGTVRVSKRRARPGLQLGAYPASTARPVFNVYQKPAFCAKRREVVA
jgi:hypothetical protein